MEDEGTTPTFIFVDLPNIIFRGDTKEPQGFSLRALFGHIQDTVLHGSSDVIPWMYWFKYHGSHLSTSQKLFNNIIDEVLGVEVVLNGKPVHMYVGKRFKDVDVHLVNGIWRSVVGRFVRGQKQLRHVLVSGDSDYARTYRQIKKEARETLDLELYQYGWRGSSSPEFRGIATAITHLETIPGIDSPIGS